jgi:hypothetical protein
MKKNLDCFNGKFFDSADVIMVSKVQAQMKKFLKISREKRGAIPAVKIGRQSTTSSE